MQIFVEQKPPFSNAFSTKTPRVQQQNARLFAAKRRAICSKTQGKNLCFARLKVENARQTRRKRLERCSITYFQSLILTTPIFMRSQCWQMHKTTKNRQKMGVFANFCEQYLENHVVINFENTPEFSARGWRDG